MPIASLPAARYLPLDHGHTMAWFDVGEPSAPPLIILHGGPGGRSRAASLDWFDGLGLRRIAFDQRGCGLSTPAGECAHNTLGDLVADIERLREHLGLARWGVVGGSWGALLAVAYAGTHPDRVSGLFLRSPFLGSVAEVDAFFAPWSRWLGDAGAAFLSRPASAGVVPSPVQLLQAVTAASAAVTGNAPGAGDAALQTTRIALAWQAFEQAQAAPGGLIARPDQRFAVPAADTVLPGLSTGLQVQQHYLQNGCFVDDVQRAHWLSRLDKLLVDRPVALVHGQDDTVCSVEVARALAARWPWAVFNAVVGAGHDMDHPALRAALVAAAGSWAAHAEISPPRRLA